MGAAAAALQLLPQISPDVRRMQDAALLGLMQIYPEQRGEKMHLQAKCGEFIYIYCGLELHLTPRHALRLPGPEPDERGVERA